jgi:hypothetical protein
LRTLDTRKAKWSYPTEPEVGMQIEYAMCKHSFDKRDGPVISEGPVVDSPLSVVASSSVTLDSQIPKLPALERGHLRIGEDVDNKQIRAVVNALNVCVNFPTPQYPNSTRTLDQSGLTICKYYAETECAEPLMLDALNDEEKDWKIRSDFAQKINSAKCTIFESIAPASIRARVPEPTLEWGPYPQSRGERPETAYRTCAANQLSTVCRLGVNRDPTHEHPDPQRTSRPRQSK